MRARGMMVLAWLAAVLLAGGAAPAQPAGSDEAPPAGPPAAEAEGGDGSRAEKRVIAQFHEAIAGGVGEDQCVVAPAETVTGLDLREQALRDLGEIRLGERAEGNDAIEPVEEFRPKKLLGGGCVDGVLIDRGGGGETES